MPRIATLLAIAVAAIAGTHPALAQAPKKVQPPFAFTQPDIKLFQECEALDRQLERRGLVLHEAAVERHLADIATPLLPGAPMERVEWHFRILRDPTVNAFALPNGSVYVNAGLIARLENDDQLAGVLAHEITHTANRHAYVFNRSLRKKVVAQEVIGGALSAIPVGGGAGSAISVAGEASQFAFISMVYGYSRELEEEADRTALGKVKAGGRDPAQFVRTFAIMDLKLEPEPVPLVWQNHPRNAQRVAYLKAALALTQDVPPAADAGYVDRMRPVLLGNIQMDLNSRRYRSALAAAQRLVRANPENSENQFWLGESYRSLGPRTPLPSDRELTDGGQRSAHRKSARQTEAEETQALAATVEGRAALSDSQRKAEEAYRKAAALDATQAKPHLGLGMLFEEEHQPDRAMAAYRQYLEMSLDGADRERVERRMASLGAAQKGAK